MTDQLKGYSYDKRRDRYLARIRFNGKNYQRRFKTKEQAHEWYREKSLELYGFDRISPSLEKEQQP